MDPLSVSASILAVIGAATTLAKVIRNVKDAPFELTEIADSVEALKKTLKEVHQFHLTGHAISGGVAFHVQRSEQKLLELSLYIHKHDLTSKGIRASLTLIRHQDKLRIYRQQLGEVRNDLSLSLSAVTYGQTGRVELDMQQLVLGGEHALDQQRKTMAALSQQTLQLDYLAAKAEEMKMAQSQMAQILASARQEGMVARPALMAAQSESLVRLSHSVDIAKIAPPETKRRSSDTAIPVVRSKIGGKSDCSSACRCACHKRRRFSTPKSTEMVIGAMSVTYSGIQSLSSSCTVKSCARNLVPLASVDYKLPRWLASNMVSIWLKAAPMQGPELLLRSRRIIETEAYYTAEQGNLGALRKLYTDGRAGIHDVNPVSGRSTLFDSIFRGHIDILQFLLQSGADKDQADFFGFTPRDLAYQRIHTTCPPALAEQLSAILGLRDFADELDFTPVHRIVMGSSNLNLEDYLSEHSEDIDATDLLGRTPLWWSVRREDYHTSSTLLAHGAKPNIANAAGRSPLHNAAAQGNLAHVDLLLAHDADVNVTSFEGKTPLQALGNYAVHEQIALRLLAAGCDVNHRDSYGRSAISLCCFDTHTNIARVLLDNNADTSLPDINGWLPWHWAIHDGASKVLELYIEHGCLTSRTAKAGPSLLHFVAHRCSAKVAEVLKSSGVLRDLDTDALDSRGLTAEAVLEERHNSDVPSFAIDESTYVAIKKLIKLVETCDGGAILPVDRVESWHTAVEDDREPQP